LNYFSFPQINSIALRKLFFSVLLAIPIAEFGDRLVDRKTNDWRAQSDGLKYADADEQLTAKPKLMTRPVIMDGDTY